jgi:hypothetical protein
MKTVKIILTLSILLAAIGCSHNTLVGIDDSTPAITPGATSTAILVFQIPKVDSVQKAALAKIQAKKAGLAKIQAVGNYNPAYAIIKWTNSTVSGRDSIALTTGQTTVTENKTFTQNTAYSFTVDVYSANNPATVPALSHGTASGTVPATTSFTVNIACASLGILVTATVNFGATASAIADSAFLSYSQTDAGGYEPINGVNRAYFPVGTKTITLNGYIYLPDAPAATPFVLYLWIYCTDGGIYENNVVNGVSLGDNVSLLATSSATWSPVMTKVGGAGPTSLGKVTVTYVPLNSLTATVSLAKQK